VKTVERRGPSDESSDTATMPERMKLYSRLALLLSGILDSISFALFYLSFSSLTHLFTAICCRLLAEE
jgi:hypothetical protein